ncbi:MAG TPA: circularly permuted type 2 ATP-grasp protein [Candidatus Acidoferrum sp.]|nr:circularly permuted type 2 ATP-grasp protein [Candidatus Acidoferrum sp.]
MDAVEDNLNTNAGSILADYAGPAGRFDAAVDGAGALRAAYRAFARAVPRLGAEDLKRRQETARRIIQEQRITYNVYGDPPGTERPWQLDPMPLLMDAAEWSLLQAALIQRATLLNGVLADCYGPQELIAAGLLPPALVFGQPDFLRPCHGLRPSGGTFLHFYAADLARSGDGQWWVLSDRTQIPTGAGYTLANRLITGRILAEAFRDCNVQRLAGFFRDAQASLARLAPRHPDNPRIVLLTPGPFHETYFEQAWLARYLGYSLVEGQDLTVRDGRLLLKTLSGLEPVDVILRRVDDEWCDPLELRNDSMLGVPGLLGALRAGNVAAANALGSGLLQSPAFMAFLPGLCRHLLGEELKLPSIATWWCGQPQAQQHVLEHYDELIVQPAFRPQCSPPEGAVPPGAAGPGDWRAQIQFQPESFVGQERMTLSTAPAWDGARLAPRPVSIRAYLVSTAAGYSVMPGGLARVGSEQNGAALSLQPGASNKDLWVLAEGPVEPVTLLNPAHQAVELRRVGNNLPSRLADNFFWLGRYGERADATARLTRSLLQRLSSESGPGWLALIEPLLNTLAKQGQIAPCAAQAGARPTPEAIEADLREGIFDAKRRGSLSGIAAEMQKLAMLVRDRTSNDLWRVLAQLGEVLAPPDPHASRLAADGTAVLNQTLLHLAAFHGLARENMTRAQGWRFLDIGLRLERAIYLCTLLDCALGSPEANNPSVLEAVLEVADSSLTYRSRYTLLPNIAAVYDLLLLDDTNPRSLLFQFNQLVKHFERLPRERESALPSPGHRVLLDCLTRLRLLDPRSLANRKANWRQSQAGAVVERLLRQLPKLSDAIAVSYFAHSAISRAGGI